MNVNNNTSTKKTYRWRRGLLRTIGMIIINELYVLTSASFIIAPDRGTKPVLSSGLWSSPTSETYITFNKQSDGLSKFHRRLLTSNRSRQRFVTGRYPLYISVKDSPTKKWLSLASRSLGARQQTNTGSSSAQVFINGTLVDLSMASWDKLGWLDEDDAYLYNDRECFSLELLAEIHTRKPCYVNVLPEILKDGEELLSTVNNLGKNDILWVTDFSLTRPGGISRLDTATGKMDKLSSLLTWPNEAIYVPQQCYIPPTPAYKTNVENIHEQNPFMCDEDRYGDVDDALLVTDGFLVPGRDDGGIYVIKQPGSSREWKVCICGNDETGWFYHRASWIDLTGDGRLSVLAARARRPIPGRPLEENIGELVFIERPKPFTYDEETGTPLDIDGTVFDPFSSRHLPWKTTILDKGPDVMFCVADLDCSDNTVEIIASQFFGKKVTLHSIEKGEEPHVTFNRIIDDSCGISFSAILADLNPGATLMAKDSGYNMVIDSGSTISTLTAGNKFSHLLVTSHECLYEEGKDEGSITSKQSESSFESSVVVGHNLVSGASGGSLYAYEIPSNWKDGIWKRNIVASGFRVRGQIGNMINPGAPGFCYTFYPTKEGPNRWSRPYICIAGDCAEAAYILRPRASENSEVTCTDYALMCEISCGGTVGSLAIGYGDCCGARSETGWANIYIPSYERDRIFVFGMGNGDED